MSTGDAAQHPQAVGAVSPIQRLAAFSGASVYCWFIAVFAI